MAIKFITDGIHINVKDKYGQMALMMAIHSKPITKLLLKHGPNINILDNDNQSVLIISIIFNKPSIAKS